MNEYQVAALFIGILISAPFVAFACWMVYGNIIKPRRQKREEERMRQVHLQELAEWNRKFEEKRAKEKAEHEEEIRKIRERIAQKQKMEEQEKAIKKKLSALKPGKNGKKTIPVKRKPDARTSGPAFPDARKEDSL